MGGPQAAAVLSTVRRDQLEAGGQEWSAEDQAAFEAPIRERYEAQGNPYYSTARLWDDGIIEPGQTRDVVGLALDIVNRGEAASAARSALSASSASSTMDAGYGIFRM